LDKDKTIVEAKEEFNNLQSELNKLTVSGKLEDYQLYEGYMEQVVMGGFDDRAQEFNQNDYVTIYNLDFCNELTSPYPVVFENGKTKFHTKLDVIEKLLKIQSKFSLSKPHDKFLMFITVNSKFLESDYDLIAEPFYKKYKKSIKNLIESDRMARLIKAYAFYYLDQIFKNCSFQVEFLPTMYYAGSGFYRDSLTNQRFPTMMQTFAILGTNNFEGIIPFKQNVEEYMNTKFLFATDKTLANYNAKRIVETDFDVDPITAIKNTYTYKNLWAAS